MADSRQSEEKSVHVKRVPIHESRDILTAKIPDGKVGRWVADRGNRIQTFKNAGYDFVTDLGAVVGEKRVDGDRAVGSTVCKMGDQDGTMLYLMAIDQELYDQDQAAKQSAVDKTEEAMQAQTEKSGHYGFYEKGHN